MSTSYTVTYTVAPELLNRAMTSWAKPYQSRRKRLIKVGLFLLGCILVGGAIGLSGVFSRLSSDMLLGLLIGFYAGLILCGVILFLGRRKVARLSLDQVAKQGPTTSILSADEVRMDNNQGRSVLTWQGFDQVILMADATALRKGAMIYPMPHSALPDGVSAQQFHADLVRWHEAAQ